MLTSLTLQPGSSTTSGRSASRSFTRLLMRCPELVMTVLELDALTHCTFKLAAPLLRVRPWAAFIRSSEMPRLESSTPFIASTATQNILRPFRRCVALNPAG